MLHVTTLVGDIRRSRLTSGAVEHHLFNDSDPDLRIRPAALEDALSITRLSTQDLPLSEEALNAARQIVHERLTVASGDDYFTIVAERKPTSQIVGWLAGGGCRGQELKGWGELYALSSDQLSSGTEIDEALLAVALNALHIAQFAGVTVLLEREDSIRMELFEDFGFIADDGTPEELDQAEGPLIRYSLGFKAS